MPATVTPLVVAKLTVANWLLPAFGAHGSMMQSGGHESLSLVLPSSQLSLPPWMPLPHALGWQLESQPSPSTRLLSSQVSGAVVVPLPQMVQALVQPSRSFALP